MCGAYSWSREPRRIDASSSETTASQAPVFDWRAAHSAANRCGAVQKCVQRAPCLSAMAFNASGFAIIWIRYSSGSMKLLRLPSSPAAP